MLFRLIGLLLVLLPLAGCATLERPETTQVIRTGQVAIRAERTTVADFLLTLGSDGKRELILSKAGSPPLLRLSIRGGWTSANGPLAGPGWEGPAWLAPGILRPWIGSLRAFEPEMSGNVHRQVESGKARSLEFRFDPPDSPEPQGIP